MKFYSAKPAIKQRLFRQLIFLSSSTPFIFYTTFFACQDAVQFVRNYYC